MARARGGWANLNFRVAPLIRLIWLFTLGSIAASLLMTLVVVAKHAQWSRDRRRRERIRAALAPELDRLLTAPGPSAVTNLNALVSRLDASERAVAAAVAIEIADRAAPRERELVTRVLEQSGAVA